MDIHNTMEDIVIEYIDEILSLKDQVCKCEQCKMDMACYALNRVKPMYMVSSRGLIHTENIKKQQKQEKIDVYTIVKEAIDIVSGMRRHNDINTLKEINHEESTSIPEYKSDSGCFYNFPQIIGRIMDSSKLDPLFNLNITLNYDTGDKLVSMFNNNWQNPITVLKEMKGRYSFWPAPIPAEKTGIQKDFYMNLKIQKTGYEPINKFFYIRIVSTNNLHKIIKKENIYYINDIFLLPEGVQETD